MSKFIDACIKAALEFEEMTKPKEKPMENKVIFESVKDFCDFWFVMLGVAPFSRDIEKAQQKGYIRKSPVEKAEEMYMKWNYNHNNNIENGWSDTVAMIYSLYNGFQYLKVRQK